MKIIFVLLLLVSCATNTRSPAIEDKCPCIGDTNKGHK
jgi:hypothetical protein